MATDVRVAVQAGIAVGLLSASEEVDNLPPLADITTRYPTYLILQKARGAQGLICEAMTEAIQQSFKT